MTGDRPRTVKPAAVAVVIVNYGTAELTISAIESVLSRPHDPLSVEVHVVDNASPGDDAARLSRAAEGWGAAVTLHLEPANHGFGRGNNLVLKALARRPNPPGKVYLLNPDARLKTDVLHELAAFLDAHPAAGAVGSGIDDPETGQAVTCAFRFPSALSEFAGSLQFGPVTRAFRDRMVPLPPDTPTSPVDWVAGASVMFRFCALEDVGFFDPDYFLYFEEVDLMFRLRRRGWEVWHCAEARVDHVEGAATGVHRRDERPRRRPPYWFDSWRLYFTKTHGTLGALAAGLATLTGSLAGDLLRRIRGRTSHVPEHFQGDFLRQALLPILLRKS